MGFHMDHHANHHLKPLLNIEPYLLRRITCFANISTAIISSILLCRLKPYYCQIFTIKSSVQSARAVKLTLLKLNVIWNWGCVKTTSFIFKYWNVLLTAIHVNYLTFMWILNKVSNFYFNCYNPKLCKIRHNLLQNYLEGKNSGFLIFWIWHVNLARDTLQQ